MIGKSSGFLETLPPQMRARIEFLRELQDKHDDFFGEYQKELKALREKYEAKYGRLPHMSSHTKANHFNRLQPIINRCRPYSASVQQACSTCTRLRRILHRHPHHCCIPASSCAHCEWGYQVGDGRVCLQLVCRHPYDRHYNGVIMTSL